MWRMEFDDYGGYDGITAAYIIFDGDKEMCTVDVRDFLPVNWSDNEEQGHEENAEARAAAELIVRAVNKELGVMQ